MNNELDYIGIGKRIRHYRKLRDMSQEQLAEKTDISVTHMSHIETGSTKLSLQVITSIAKELEVKIDMLIYDQDKQSDYCYEIEDIVSSSSKKEQKLLYNALKSIKASLNS